jgi:uncharacterized protein YjfI (DUF2170 family)
MSQLKELAIRLSDAQWEGRSFNCLPMPGAQEVLQVTLSDQDEIPLYLTITETQILCIAYLFKKDEVKNELVDELNEQCLQLNISMPLSSFAKTDNQYVLFGALSTTSTFEDIQKELLTLSENAVEALEALEDYLK